MDCIDACNNLFPINNFKWTNLKCDNNSDVIPNKNFINGLQNARKLLEGLELSLKKSAEYEAKLLLCKSGHWHGHYEKWWSSDQSTEKVINTPKKDIDKLSRNHVNLAESWSTISIVCLQYQYEELSKRYEALLQEYHNRSDALTARDATLARLKRRVQEMQAQLTHAHKTLLTIGEKYLALFHKKKLEKQKYKKKIECMTSTVRGMMAMCEHTRLELDSRIARFMEKEQQAPNAQLLVEIRKCNYLYLENLRLKAQIDKLSPGLVSMKT